MSRFYRFRPALAAVVLALASRPALAQTPGAPGAARTPAGATPVPAPSLQPGAPDSATAPTAPLIGTAIPSAALDDLPASGNLLSLIDALAADVISDRIDTGGLTPGAAARLGGHGSTWSQTRYLLDGADITDPDGSGTPFLLPGVLEWDQVEVRTGAMPIDVSSIGLAVSLKPRRPTAEWTRRVDLTGSRSFLVAGPAVDLAPTISHANAFANGSFLVSGPLLPHLGIVAAGSWIASSRFDRTDPTELSSSLGSMFAHLVYTPDDRNEARLVAWVQRAAAPLEDRVALKQPAASETDRSAHGQLTWDRRLLDGRQLLSGFASFSIRQRSPDLAAPSASVMDRVFDGPVTALLYPGFGTDRGWSVGARLQPATEHAVGARGVRAGVEVSGGLAEQRQGFSGTIGESVNGVPARVWSIADSGMASRWSDTTVALYASDRLQLVPRVAVELGSRFEAVTASSDGGSGGISWHNFLPRASFRWAMLDWKQISAFATYGRTAYQLPLTALAWGDSTAASGSVYRWNAATASHAPLPGEIGPLVQRIGPGGTAGFAGIDPALERPYMDEMTFGFEGWANRSTRVRLSAIARREQQLLGVADVGAPKSSYALSFVSDPGADLASQKDDQQLPIYNRLPASFGLDRYLLTNPSDNEGTFVGVDVNVQSQTDRVFFVLAGTAGRSEGLAGNRGFLATENDEGVLGEVFIDPNARTFAQGRLFTERGYTIKTAGTYRFDHDVRLGIIARYQDGQHFSRLVIAPNLNQGPEMIRAFRDGKTRFTYTMTVDARLQKGFMLQGYRVTAMLDAYNVFNQHTEIEEYPVTGPLSRSTTAIQPPRAIHVGLRVTF